MTVSTAPARPLHLRYRGVADRVALRTFMPRFPSPLEFEATSESRWTLELDLPHDARIEYLLEVERDGATTTGLDPANPLTATNPFGTNSVFVGPQWRRVDWMRRTVESGHHEPLHVASRALAERRQHRLYSPPQLGDDEPAPLLFVHDGSDYINHAGLLRCLDWLIAHKRIEPVRVVGLNPKRRHVHYIGNAAHAAHVTEEVLPRVAAVAPHDGRSFIMGASLGAVAAWHTAWRYPGVFDGAFLQSGTFAFDAHPELTSRMHRTISDFVSEAAASDALDAIPVLQTCGRYESLIDWNRDVSKALGSANKRHVYRETWSGHDWGSWSGMLIDGLTHMLGLPSAP